MEVRCHITEKRRSQFSVACLDGRALRRRSGPVVFRTGRERAVLSFSGKSPVPRFGRKSTVLGFSGERAIPRFGRERTVFRSGREELSIRRFSRPISLGYVCAVRTERRSVVVRLPTVRRSDRRARIRRVLICVRTRKKWEDGYSDRADGYDHHEGDHGW